MTMMNNDDQMEHSSLGLLEMFDLSELMLNFEIPAEAWRGKSTREKLDYLKTILSKKERKRLINTGSRVLSCFMAILRTQVKNPVAKEYIGVADTAINLFKVHSVLRNMFKAVVYVDHDENDEIAHFLGYAAGGDVMATSKDVTPEICESFLNMSWESQEMFGVRIERVVDAYDNDDDDAAGSDAKDATFVLKHVLLHFAGHRYGIEVQYSKPKKRQGGSIKLSSGSYMTIARGYDDLSILDDGSPDVTSEAIMLSSDMASGTAELWNIIYRNYINTIDITSNLIKIDGGVIRPCPRVNIDFSPNNFDMDEMVTTMRTILTLGKRRGYILQGDPGTGKTVSIHKILMSFTDVPVFWITADSMQDVSSMKNVFKILNMFPGSIFVFDDFDGNDYSQKGQMTTTFITCIDETNSPEFSGITILTINEPQRVHSSIKDRRGRIDDIIHVGNPGTVEAVTDVIRQRYIHMKAELPEWISVENPEYVSAVEIMVSNKFTHAHISGIISDLVELHADSYDCSIFRKLIERRIETIANARMVAYDDGHITERSGPAIKNPSDSDRNAANIALCASAIALRPCK